MKKNRKKLLLIIPAVIVTVVAVIAYFLPIGLIVHTIRVFSDEDHPVTEVLWEGDTIHFVHNGKHMVFEAKVNGEHDTLIFDSGVNTMMAMMYTPSTRPEGMKFYRQNVIGADKLSRIKTTTFPVRIGTNGVTNMGIGRAILNPEPSLCEKYPISKHHLLGFSGFSIGHYMMDFTRHEIVFTSYSEQMDTTGFVPIKCAVRLGVLFVYPQIDGVEYECIFDTGNGNTGFLLKDKQRVKNPKADDCVYEGSYGKGIGGQANKQGFVRVPQETFGFGGVEKETEVTYVKDLPMNNMGLKAISQYDWIVSDSYGGPKVYVRPHAVDEVKLSDTIRYRLVVDEGRLMISARLIDGKEAFKVGDEIVSVNGESITEENICHYYDLLTENQNWSEFEIQVK